MELKNGFQTSEVGVIPKEWEIHPLEYYCSFISYGFTNPMPESRDGVYLVTARDVVNGQINFNTARKTPEWAYSKLLSDKSRPKKGDILLTKDGTLGRLAVVDDQKVCINQSVAVIRPNTRVFASFLKILLESERYQRVMLENAGGSTIKHIYITIVNRMPIGLPTSKPEQTAIATALSDMDALIAQTEKLIAKKKAIKQGVMQRLLSPYDEQGNLKKGWVKIKLGEICEIRKGQLITETTRVDGSIPVIAGGKTPAYYHNSHNRIGKTITISGSGASAGYISIHYNPIFASDCSTISESKKYVIEYVFYFLALNQNIIYKMQTGGAQPHIHPSDLEPLEIGMPDIEIQQSISKSIIEIDTEIKVLQKLNRKQYLQKQGMMQNLLTGKIRIYKPSHESAATI